MTPGFSITDHATWPELLTSDEVAAIWRISLWNLNRQLRDGTFVPAPMPGTRRRGDRRWRKADIVRYVAPGMFSGARGLVRRVG